MGTSIELSENDSALILREDGRIEAILPKFDSDSDQVQYKDLFMAAVSARMVADPKFVEQQVEWLEKQVAKERSKEGKRKKHPSKKDGQLELPGLEGEDGAVD